ncbi:MAG: hypothetical protein GXO18_05560 [Aquificae bacterium]|nr:hypothetical protein [Aquificota bacterium]
MKELFFIAGLEEKIGEQRIDVIVKPLGSSDTIIEKWNLTPELLENPEIVETIDSFIFRFSKMQSMMGEKLFPLILEVLGEEPRKRNIHTHTYPWEKELLIENIKTALKKSEDLIKTYESIKV